MKFRKYFVNHMFDFLCLDLEVGRGLCHVEKRLTVSFFVFCFHHFDFSPLCEAQTRITVLTNLKMRCKTVLITGANSGIGFLAAQRLVSMGRKVLVACRSSEKARETAKKTGAIPIETPLELNNIDSVRNFANHVVDSEYSDELDTIVHNAGVFLSEDAKDTLKINAVSPAYLSSLLSDLKHLKRTVCVITSPQAQGSMGLPCPEDLEGTRTCTGILAGLKTYVVFEREAREF
jgi:hypothetical protein